MKTIWKFTLEWAYRQLISMPEGARILAVQVQGENPCIWAEVDPDAPKENRYFALIGTGQPVPDDVPPFEFYTYLGTVQESTFVWHIYEFKS